MKCTIQNIADHLGLSRNTVSKALKNSSEVSENTRNLVIKTASKLGYKNATFATDRKSTRLNSSHSRKSRMPSSA